MLGTLAEYGTKEWTSNRTGKLPILGPVPDLSVGVSSMAMKSGTSTYPVRGRLDLQSNVDRIGGEIANLIRLPVEMEGNDQTPVVAKSYLSHCSERGHRLVRRLAVWQSKLRRNLNEALSHVNGVMRHRPPVALFVKAAEGHRKYHSGGSVAAHCSKRNPHQDRRLLRVTVVLSVAPRENLGVREVGPIRLGRGCQQDRCDEVGVAAQREIAGWYN
jgi:hypothetical protein